MQPILNFYLVPWPGGRVACGGTFEADAGFDTRPTAGGVRDLLRECVAIAPGLAGATFAEVRVGLRPTSADDRPLLGPLPGFTNVHVCTGHGANGLLLGPYSAALVAAGIDGRTGARRDALRPGSFLHTVIGGHGPDPALGSGGETDPVVGLASAGTAPVLLIGGWTLAQARQPPGYDPIRDTISALAARGATDRWVMTSALLGLGACHVVTAAGLRPARRAGRVLLAAGGVATVMVAAFPQPVRGNSPSHTVAAAAAFIALGAWPAFAGRRRSAAPLLHARRPRSRRPRVLLGLVVWFAAEVHGDQRGLAERAAAGAQALWPLAVVVTTRRAWARAAPVPSPGPPHRQR